MSYATICHDKLEYFPKRSPVPSTTISDIGGYFTDLLHLPGNWIIEHYWTYDIGTFLENQCPGFNTWMSFLVSIPLWLLAWVALMLLLSDWQIFPARRLTAEQQLAESRSVESIHTWLRRISIGIFVVLIGGLAMGLASGYLVYENGLIVEAGKAHRQ
jgi:hypothetical protein